MARTRSLDAGNPSRYFDKTILSPDMTPAVKEQFRNLATKLHHTQGSKGLKTLVISSALASEGKTLTSINLALTLSESFKRRVLLIDADFRRPSLHDLLALAASPGFADALVQGTDAPLAPYVMTPYLSVLTAGSAIEPISVLSSRNLPRVLDRAKDDFDWILLDTPPIGLLSDAGLIAAHADGVLLVVAAGKTPVDLVQRAVATFGRERIVGTVLNRVEPDAVAGGYHYSYDQYYRRDKGER
ncbi:MAG: CpsD/CapB family tyrosine-protein kinase [Vicinamibacterales bacterium]